MEGLWVIEQHPEEERELLTDSGALFNNMAGLFCAQGEYEKAMEYYEKALAARKTKLGEAHPYTQDPQMSVQIMELLIDIGIDEELLIDII